MSHQAPKESTQSAVFGLSLAFAILAVGMVVAFMVGRYSVGFGELIRVIWARMTGVESGVDPMTETIVWKIRAPRVLAAVMIGCALAAAGAAFQGLFRNPLVSPDILGASSGAALGAILGIYVSLDVVGIQFSAFLGGLAAVCAVYFIGAALRAGDVILTLVLTGVVISSLLGAGIGLIKYIADPYDQLPAMTFWLLGSLAGITSGDLLPLILPVVLGLAVLGLLRWRMNVMSLPEEEARALGVPTTLLRVAIVIAATLVTSASVAAAGIVGWVGLIIPHVARFLVGPSFPRLLPTAAVLGAGFVLLVDTLARSAAAVEIPLGILTAVIGTPFFIWVLSRARGTWS